MKEIPPKSPAKQTRTKRTTPRSPKPERAARVKPAAEPVQQQEPTPPPVHGDWRVYAPVQAKVEKRRITEHLSYTPDAPPPEKKPAPKSQLQAPPQKQKQLLLPFDDEEAMLHDYDEGVAPISGLRRVGRIFWATVLFLPLSLVLSFALLRSLLEAMPKVDVSSLLTSTSVWSAFIGLLVFFILFLMRVFGRALLYVYILGHELTHALTSILCFRGVAGIKVSLDGGYVDTEADNPVVALSPYFVPFWLIVWMGSVWAVQKLFPFHYGDYVLYGGFGFWLTFHVYWTIWVIPREQPDLLENGLYFSTLFIGLMNLIMLVIILAVFEVISWAGFYGHIVEVITLFVDIAARLYARV